MGKIIAICTSEKKGTVKHETDTCYIKESFGIVGDAHAGSERQVSLLSYESFIEFKESLNGKTELYPGVFGENLLVEGLDLLKCTIGTRYRCGSVILEVMQIGKKCHSGCEISKITGKCIMPAQGVFARVISGGVITKGDMIEPVSSRFTAAVLTSSDSSYHGARKDLSGPAITSILSDNGYEVVSESLLPDDREELSSEMKHICDEIRPDILITTGGTGLGPRDIMPEATLDIADRMVPGIAEALRSYSMSITPRAMLSRGVSVIRGKTLIINLPGSPKAVTECLEYIIDVLDHGIKMMNGGTDGH